MKFLLSSKKSVNMSPKWGALAAAHGDSRRESGASRLLDKLCTPIIIFFCQIYNRMAKVPFLPPTDFQSQILKHYVEELGMGVGVTKLYERLKRDIGDTTHPALDKAGKIKYTDDGKAWELSNTPTNLKGDEYVEDGVVYTYQTRMVTRAGKKSKQRRKLLPTRLVVMHYLRKNETHQRNRMPRQRPGAGTRTAPKTTLSPVLPKYAKPLDLVFCDSYRMPKCIHRGKEYSWVFLCVDALTKIVFMRHVYLNTQLSTGAKEQRPQSAQTWKIFEEFISAVNQVAPGSTQLHPRLVVCDLGSEFAKFPKKLAKLAEQHKGYYKLTQNPGNRSRYNSLSERSVQNARRRLMAMNQSYMKQAKKLLDEDKAVTIPHWHTDKQSHKNYNWVLDISEAQKRINTAWQATTKLAPYDALSNKSNWKVALANIKKRAAKIMKGVTFDKRLPGFSPSSPLQEGDYARLRLFKPDGVKAIKWSGLNTKSSRDNFSKDIYRIIKKTEKASGATVYHVENIDATRKAPKAALDRTQLLKVDPETTLENGRTIREEDDFINREQGEEDEDEGDAAPAAAPKVTRSSREKEIQRLVNQSGKQWTKLLRDKQFDSDGERQVITKVDYRSPKFGWVIEFESVDQGDKAENYFETVFEEAANESWMTPLLKEAANNNKFVGFPK